MVDSLLAIHQQEEDTARICELSSGVLGGFANAPAWIALTISAGWNGTSFTVAAGNAYLSGSHNPPYVERYVIGGAQKGF